MITRYERFVMVKEEAEFGGTAGAKKIGALFRNMLGSLVKGVKDELKQPLEDLNKKLGTRKNQAQKVKALNDYLIIHQKDLQATLDEAKTVPGVADAVEDNLRTVYAAIDAFVKNYGQGITLDGLFTDLPQRTEKLLTSTEKKFDKYVKDYAHDLVLSFAKKYGFTEKDLEKTPEEAATEQGNKEIEKGKNDKEFIENLSKLKNDIKTWFGHTIYANTRKSIDELKKKTQEPGKEQEVNIERDIQNIPPDVTTHKDSVRKMMDNLSKADRETLMKIRGMLGMDKNNAPL